MTYMIVYFVVSILDTIKTGILLATFFGSVIITYFIQKNVFNYNLDSNVNVFLKTLKIIFCISIAAFFIFIAAILNLALFKESIDTCTTVENTLRLVSKNISVDCNEITNTYD